MGRYIDEILQPGERVLYSTNEHWMFFLPAIAAWIVAVAFLVLWRLVTADALMLVCLALAAVAGLAALYWTATAWFHRWTTETDVTNMRVVHKTGFIKRRTFEMSLDKVESVDVNQSILGRHDPRRDCLKKEHPVLVGRIQHPFAGLQDFVDITTHTPTLN